MNISKYALSVGAASLLALSFAANASAAPVLSNTEALKSASDPQVTQVRWRNGAAVAVGVGAGIVAGAAIANSNNNYYYSDPYYAPAPEYYAAEPDYGYYGYAAPAGPSHRWYNGRRDTNATNNW